MLMPGKFIHCITYKMSELLFAEASFPQVPETPLTSQIWFSFQAPFQSAVRGSERFFVPEEFLLLQALQWQGRCVMDARQLPFELLAERLLFCCRVVACLLQSCCRVVACLLQSCCRVVAELLRKHGRRIARLRNNPAINLVEIAPTCEDTRSPYKTHIPAVAEMDSILRNPVF